MRTPTLERPDRIREGWVGTQKLYRFGNGFGASVVRNAFSYGGSEGLWELAVIRFADDKIESYSLTYDTPITDDVLGWLAEAEVDEALARIEALPHA